MNKIVRMLMLLLLIAGITTAVVFREQIDANALQAWVINSGTAGPIVFMNIYIIGTVFFLPGSVLTLAGEALFGPIFGTLYSLTGVTIGAMISFLAARNFGYDWVEKKRGVEAEGWRFVAFVRLVPLFPFNILNYALGLTKIKFSHYSIASYICMLPGAFAFTYLGYASREAIADGESLIQKILFAIALLAVVGFLASLIARLRRGPMMEVNAVKQLLEMGDDYLLLDIRTADDFVGEQGHVKQAMLIPIEELHNRISEITNFQKKTVMTICRTDRRSAKAAQLQFKNGFTDVHIVRNGMSAWNDANYVVEY